MPKNTATPRVSRKRKKASPANTAKTKLSLTVSSDKRSFVPKQQIDVDPTKETIEALAKAEHRAEQLSRSEGRFRALLEVAAQGILAVERSGRIGWVNRTAEKMFGYSREELVGQPLEMLLSDHLRRAHRRYLREFFAHPRTFPMGRRLDLFARRKDGTTFPVEISLSDIEPEGYTVAATFISDITERKRFEQELRVQAEITANMSEGISLVRQKDAVIVYANDQYHRLFGYEPGELHGRPVTVLNTGSRAEASTTAEEIIRVLNHDRAWTGEVRNVRKDGTVFWSSATVSTLEHDQYGTVWLGVLRDITPYKQAETALRQEHALNTALLDTVRALVVVLDREGRVVRFNKACQEITGYSFEEVRGRRLWELLLVPEEVAPVRRMFRKLKAGQFPVQLENYWVTKKGQRRLISWSNTALLDASGTMSFGIGTGLDITEQRQMEKTIRESHSDLRQLNARLISAQEGAYQHLARELHDGFSQKLAILGMHVSDLERKLSAAGMTMEKGLEPIGEEISGLATEIHGISRRLHPVILDDLGLVIALRNECLAFSREHGINVRFYAESVPDSLPNGVALCLYRAAQESLNNIRKHAKTSQARVTLTGHPREIVLSIEDVGKGFQPEEVRGKGGLGLVSMEERARLVGGKLTIRSKPGDGTTIEVRVPLAKDLRRRRKQ